MLLRRFLLPFLLAASFLGAAPQEHPKSRPKAAPQSVRREGARDERDERREREVDPEHPLRHIQLGYHGDIKTRPQQVRKSFRSVLATGDAVGAAARLRELIPPGSQEVATHRELAAELRARIQAQTSVAAKRSDIALLKYVKWDRVEFESAKDGLYTRARFVDPDLTPATAAQIGSRPVYIADGAGLAAVDAGPPLVAAIQAGYRAGRLDVRRMLHADLASVTVDRLTIESQAGRIDLQRKTKDLFSPESSASRCDPKLPADAPGACAVFLIFPRAAK